MPLLPIHSIQIILIKGLVFLEVFTNPLRWRYSIVPAYCAESTRRHSDEATTVSAFLEFRG